MEKREVCIVVSFVASGRASVEVDFHLLHWNIDEVVRKSQKISWTWCLYYVKTLDFFDT